MQIQQMPIEALIPYIRNPRKNDEQVDRMCSAIREFGFRIPVVAKSDGSVVDGHLRLKAAIKLGMTEVPVALADELTDAQVKAFRLLANKSANWAEWDDELLKIELGELEEMGFDLDLTGFTADEIDALNVEVEQVEGNTDSDEIPEPPVDPVTKPGDVWILGKHRLMCGDSTSVDAVETLMEGKQPDMVFTDPPYNIGYQDMTGQHDKIKNDKMSDADFLDFLVQTVMPCEVMYVCCSWQYAHLFKQAMEDLGKPAKAMIVWDKINPAQHLDLYFKQHEIIYYHGPFGGQTTVRGDVWQLKRQRNTVHPTMKPVELIEMALEDHPGRRVVYDGFGGSGSTLMACEVKGRHARLMELEAKYCDVIVKRWQEFTGKAATLESDGSTFDSLVKQ